MIATTENIIGAVLMNEKIKIKIPEEKIAQFCEQNHIRKLSLFGSVLSDNFQTDSDIDVLVEFEPGHVPGYITLAGMMLELSDIFEGRKVDLNTPKCLSRYFRNEVLSTAEPLYG